MDVVVLQHIACEPPGEYEAVLRERGATLHRVELDEGEPLPTLADFDAIVAMGGPMSVNDDAELPWLTAEKAAIGAAVRAGVPYFGACLGVQLLAASLGARVYAGPEPEVGVLPVTLTADGAADPLFAGLPASFPTLQWHGDTFDLPEGATLLASSPAFPNQAFRYGRSCRSTPATPTACSARAAWGGCWPISTAPRRACGRPAGRCSSAGPSLPSPSPDSRFLALRFAAQDATDFAMSDDQVRRYMALRDGGASALQIAEQLGVPNEVAAALVKADAAQELAGRIAAGEEPMYPPPPPEDRVADVRLGSSRVPFLVLVLVLLGVIVYALAR
jgi:GMP synthase-like glutamine amidotransferase